MNLTYASANNGRLRITVAITYVLTLLGFGLIGLIVAYVKRADAYGTLWQSHFSFIIRTFWLTLIGLIIGGATTFILIGYVILLLVGIWSFIRMLVGLLRALGDQPIHDPKSFFL